MEGCERVEGAALATYDTRSVCASGIRPTAQHQLSIEARSGAGRIQRGTATPGNEKEILLYVLFGRGQHPRNSETRKGTATEGSRSSNGGGNPTPSDGCTRWLGVGEGRGVGCHKSGHPPGTLAPSPLWHALASQRPGAALPIVDFRVTKRALAQAPPCRCGQLDQLRSICSGRQASCPHH